MRDKKWSREYDKRLKRVRVMQDLAFATSIIILIILLWNNL